VRSALRGTIRIVATDHAPHLLRKSTRAIPISEGAGRLPGLQTFLLLMLRLVGEGVLDYPGLVRPAAKGRPGYSESIRKRAPSTWGRTRTS
jgi:dihydroorotase-like cyclic amidohydrolase